MVELVAPFGGWLSVLDEVDDAVFAGRMMGDGVAIDPIDTILHAPADATVIALPDSAHAVTLRLDNGVELLLHVGLDTVALKGRGFTAHVDAGQRVVRGAPLISFDPAVVGAGARDLVTPIVAPDTNVRVTAERPGRLVAAGDVIARVHAAAADETAAPTGAAIERTITVAAPLGIHARPAARIVALLKPFAARVTLHRDDRTASAASTVALLTLAAQHGDRLVASAIGPDAAAALDALARFAEERFGDPATPPPEAPPAPVTAGGVCAAPGLAIGTIFQFRPIVAAVKEQGDGRAAETAALDDALARVAVDLAARTVVADLAAAHLALLEDPALRASADAALAEGASAGAAWRRAAQTAADALEATGDVRLAERAADLRDLEQQVLLALAGGTPTAIALPAQSTILVAHDLLPSQFLTLDRARLAGIVTAAGGPTAHVAILAAAAGVPMIVAAGADVLAHRDGAVAILDADAVRLTVDPSPDLLAATGERLAASRATRDAERAAAVAPAHTADGVRIEVFANLASVKDAAAAVNAGAEGCGLLRTEFLFLDRTAPPDEAEQRALYARIATTLDDRPLIVRTLDIGADKPVAYLPQPPEENPALGQRGIRLSLARGDLLATQLRAILDGVPGAQCRIMLPMVADLAELLAARAALDRAMAETGRKDAVQLGVMIETPAAALIADRLAAHADFLSVGTNDLTQYAMAADRGNAAVAALVDPFHPAVLRLIELAAAGAAAHGRWLGVCGGLASDPRAAALLIGLGVTELSAVPSAIPAVKAAVRRTTMAAARDLAHAALAASSAAQVRQLVEDAA